MKHIVNILLAGLVFIGCRCTGSEKSTDRAVIRKEIDEILAIQEQAYHDNSEAGRLRFASTCDDSLFYVGGDSGGFVASADVYVHDFADGYSRRPYDKRYRILDNTVFVTFLTQTFKRFGKDTVFFNTRGTKVFVSADGSWKMAYVTYAPLPVNYQKRVSVDAAVLQDYVGLYREDDTTIDSVAVKDGRLYLGTAGSQAAELIPVNDSTFISDDYFGKTVFSRDRNSRVTRWYFEFPDGQRLVFPRIK
jgi:hypothetical protein